MSYEVQQSSNRRTNLQILEDRREELKNSLVTYKHFIETIPKEKQEGFKRNFLGLATQDYLMSIVQDKELIRFAVEVSNMGLDILPSANECYIIPFDTKVNNVKTMLPQVVIPLNGNQQLAFQKDFMLTVDAVYKFDDETEGSERELTRKQQSQLKTADPIWVDKHFIGFDVILVDLLKELPTQTKFVDKNYVEEATKQLIDKRWKIQSWIHKATRRAIKEFAIPKHRKLEAFEQIESLNDSVLEIADVSSGILLTSENEKALEQLGVRLQKFNGIAIASNFQGKEKYLQDMGFIKNGGNWSIEYVEKPSQIPAPKNVEPKKENKGPISPAAKLFSYLNKKQLDKEQIKVFVNDVLGLTKEDTEGINEVLADLASLDIMVDEFLSNFNVPMEKEGLETGSLF